MSKSPSNAYKIALEGAIALAQDLKTHPEAKAQFDALYQDLAADTPQAADLLKQLWEELIAARRASAFWHEMSDAEKHLADRMGESNIQLQRNYMRLVQEQ
ncbi:MAG: hypothetical protein AAF152_09465 [Cyanobacteria bacterium P01_A01_bin.114]